MALNEGTARMVSRTVWVIAQLRGYDTRQALADAMGWDRSRLSRTLSGNRQWTVEDLDTAANALGVETGDLFRPLSELVGAVSDEGITAALTTWVPTPMLPPSEPSAEVIPFPRVYRSVSGSRTTALAPVTHLGASHGGHRAYSA
jgi:transcriptional regulator with XRE-family HTH domain